VTTLSDRVGISPTRLLAMVNAGRAGPAREESQCRATSLPVGRVERRLGWTESVVSVYARRTDTPTA